jgi:hypothetical protein
MYRRWEAIRFQDPSVDTFDEWVRDDAAHVDLDTSNPDDMDRLMLSTKPLQRAVRYTRMKAFGNHLGFKTIRHAVCKPMTVELRLCFKYHQQMQLTSL